MEPIQQPGYSPISTPLPLYLTHFVGREQECATLTTLLTSKHLLTLVGAGGIGKTRLALQIATEARESFTDGVCLTELGTLSDPQLVPQSIASALNIRTDRDVTILTLLQSALRERHLLLILDTCEHILSACASLAETLLQTCPRLHILATSREPLHVAGETVWRVNALSSPDPEHIPPFEQISQYEAVQLFCERATDINPHFRLIPQNTPAIARICYQLDGLPLALELAAARLPMLSVDQLAARLSERFQLLTHGKWTSASRMQTLQATLDWSFGLLTPAEQALFPCLAVFAGSWSLDAVEQICTSANAEGYAVFDVLAHLVNKSLVIAEEQEGQDGSAGEVRYRLLDTMYQYALQKLQQTGRWQQLCQQHYTWYLHLAVQAQEHLTDKEQAMWLHRLEIEQANLRASLTRTIEAGQLDMSAQLADALRRFWITHNHFSEGRHWFETILMAERTGHHLSPSLRTRVLFGASEFARYQGAFDRARTLLEEEIALLQTLDDAPSLTEAQAYLGAVAGLQGDNETAARLCQISLEAYRKAGQADGIAGVLITLGLVTLSQGNIQRAIEISEEACQLLRERGNHAYLLYALFILAQATLFQKDRERSRAVCREALYLSQTLEQTYGIAASLGLIGGIADLDGQPAQAARFFGAAHALQERVQATHPPTGRALQERMILSVRTALGKEQFMLHYSAGRTCPLEQILQEAEAILQPDSAPGISESLPTTPIPPILGGLSRREREILSLVAMGFTDAQIAQQLFLSPRTVGKHLQSIYTKLNVNSRSAATRLALEHGLV